MTGLELFLYRQYREMEEARPDIRVGYLESLVQLMHYRINESHSLSRVQCVHESYSMIVPQ